MVCLAYFAGGLSDSSRDSTHSLRSSASLPPTPVNHAGQHLRGSDNEFRQPSQTQVSEHSPYTSIPNLLHIRINTLEYIPSLVKNPVSHGRKV